jgi:phosphoadenosine phosphosulfate reductase
MTAALEARVATLGALLDRIAAAHRPAALASSLSAEDMVIADAIYARDLPIAVFTLDTGRLHGDTLALLDAIRTRYGREVAVYRPQDDAVAAYVAAHGRDAFYAGTQLRKECCAIRKVEPLARALAGKGAWITGLRREQSPTRADLPVETFDAVHGIPKFSPLADWSEADVWTYIRARDVPYNRLHDRGYRSIGCAPCTRPTVAGEDVRAGRWWWEQPEAKECGLHVDESGRLVRARDVQVPA